MDVERITLALQQQRAGAKPVPVPPPEAGTGSSLLIQGSTMTDSMLSSATTSDHDPDASSSASAPSSHPQPTDSHFTPPTIPSQSHHSRSQSRSHNSPELDTSVLLNSNTLASEWVAEFQSQLTREQPGPGGSPMSRTTSESLILSGTQTSISLPPSDADADGQQSESGLESVSAQSGVVRFILSLICCLAYLPNSYVP